MNEIMGRRIPLLAPLILPPTPSKISLPTGGEWWDHHTMSTRAYAEASLRGDEKAALGAIANLWKSVLDWQRITRSPIAGVLMAEHTALAKQFVDGLAKGKHGWIDTAAEGLVANVEAQGKLFPKNPEEFQRLFGEHVRILALYPVDLAKGDWESFREHFSDAMRNADELGQFTDDTFGV